MVEPLIHVDNLVKKFGPFIALNGVNLEVYPGEVHALLVGGAHGVVPLLVLGHLV